MRRSGHSMTVLAARALVVGLLSGAVGSAEASLVGAGDIAFIRFNADSPDDIAIVLLADADAGQQVHFNSNLYNPALNVFSSTTPRFTWEIDTALAAGTVVTFTGLSVQGGGAVSHGSLMRSASGPTAQTMPLSDVADTVYAFLGSSSSPTTFLAAITTEGASRITDAGLTPGVTGVVLTAGADEAHYVGLRAGELTFPDYLSRIGQVGANWQVRTANTGSLSPPFDSTNFTLQGGVGTPEPPQWWLLSLLPPLLANRHVRRLRGATRPPVAAVGG